MSKSDKIAINPAMLKREGLFAGLSDEELKELAGFFRVAHWPPGGRIITEGERDAALYIVYAGGVDILKQVALREGKREEKIASLGVGDTFGEMALLDQQPRSASVVANADSVVLVLDQSALGKLDPAIHAKMLVNITREVSRRLRATDRSFAVSLFSIHEQARFRVFPTE
jgi:CRP-like cAMP-binding protein